METVPISILEIQTQMRSHLWADMRSKNRNNSSLLQ